MYLGYQKGKVIFYTETPLNEYMYKLDETVETEDTYTLCGEEYFKEGSKECTKYLNSLRIKEIKERLLEIDIESTRPLRAILAGDATDYDKVKLKNLNDEAEALREELRNLES